MKDDLSKQAKPWPAREPLVPLAGESVYDRERGDDKRHHIVLPCEGEKSYLFLRGPDFEHEWCDIPLGKVANRKREDAEYHARNDAEGESTNILVPVLPRVYTGPEPVLSAVDRLQAGDRVYVFVDGYLWRELQAAQGGELQDVNLEYVAGRDGPDRPATTASIPRLVLPYRINDYEPEIRIAVSKTPWSWERINSLGGMRPDDFRLEQAGKNGWADKIPPTPEQKDGARERLEARTQPIDLSDYPSDFSVKPPSGRSARIARARSRDDTSISDDGNTLFVHPKQYDESPWALLLHDPIRVAMNLAARTEEGPFAICVGNWG